MTWSALFSTPHRKTSMEVKPRYLQVHALQESFTHKSKYYHWTQNFDLWDCGQFLYMGVTSLGDGIFDNQEKFQWRSRVLGHTEHLFLDEDFHGQCMRIFKTSHIQTLYPSVLLHERRQCTWANRCPRPHVTWDKENLDVLRDVPLRVAVNIALWLHEISKTWAAWIKECWALCFLFTRNFWGSNESLPYISHLAQWPVALLFLYAVGFFKCSTLRTVFWGGISCEHLQRFFVWYQQNACSLILVSGHS